MKSSLNKRRIKTDPVFVKFRACSKLFGKASKLSSSIYRSFSKEKRLSVQFCKLNGEVFQLLRAGMNEEQVKQKILVKYGATVEPQKEILKQKCAVVNTTFNNDGSSLIRTKKVDARGRLVYNELLRRWDVTIDDYVVPAFFHGDG